MTDHLPRERLPGSGGDVRSPAHPRHDRDLDLRGVLGFWAAVTLLIIACAWICAALAGALRAHLVALDPAPSPLAAARLPELPPEPRLQRDPAADMAALVARETATLNSHGWVDQSAGIARIPVEKAMELRLSSGLAPALAQPEAAPGRDGGAP